MKVTRKFTHSDKDVYKSTQWTTRSCKIASLDGSTVFEMNDVLVPKDWSQLATDIMVSKYFRKAGVPQVDEAGQPELDENGQPITGPERSAQQVIHRLAGCWRHWGETHKYFDTPEDADAFQDELAYMLLHQMAAPNSPQWFNTGLNWAYGITGPAQGHYYVDPQSGQVKQSDDAYSHPQPHACFIQSICDDLVNPGGIMDLWVREARLFKYGSGTGTNFSMLRGENESLSGGGKSSGLMSWLRIGDRAAGAIKSGGTTRRAAKMVCLDLDHPDVEQFINWKVREEIKVAALVEGAKHLDQEHRETAQRLDLKLDYDFNGEAYATVSGQNSNNSVRISNEFFKTLDEGGVWDLTYRISGKVAKTIPASRLWGQVAYAAWRCADPGVQFDTTINQWHTCPASGRINASNPCSEYMFLDNTACNLASLNLLKFYDAKTRSFDIESYEHAIRLWTVVLEISVLMAAFPSEDIARFSYEYRTLGLGYANIGAMLMQAGIPYDSDTARVVCGALTAILTGRSYATSAEMAAQLGPFPGYFKNREHMLRVIRNHRRAAYGVPREPHTAREHELGTYEALDIPPVPIELEDLNETLTDDATGQDKRLHRPLANAETLLTRAQVSWDDALELGRKHGYRNAQTTVIAPTGTIGLLMDCDTTGVEPDFALVKFKKLAGGGYFKIANQSLRPALESLGYSKDEVKDVMRYVLGMLNLDAPMPDEKGQLPQEAQQFVTFEDFLVDKGLLPEDLRRLTDALPTVFELPHAFNAWVLGPEAMERLDLAGQANKPGFNLLRAMGLTNDQVKTLDRLICGTQTVEGAPHLKEEHLPVFDCANQCGAIGKRFIAAEGHIRMMAAAQSFISGAISKTINLPHSANMEDIQKAYRMSWELGLKANALYRDGCKLSQPLNTKVDADQGEEDEDAIEAAKEEVAVAVVVAAGHAANSDTLDDNTIRQHVVEKVVERIVERPLRRRLPDTRRSITHKFNVAGHEGYLTVGLYENGFPGELFITMAKEGSTIGGLMDSLGTAISVALQYGVPVESLVDKFTHQRFEPAGMTHNQDIPFAKSLVDYIFRWLGMEFIPGYRQANAPRRSTQPNSSVSGDEGATGHELGKPSSPTVIVPSSTNSMPKAKDRDSRRSDLLDDTTVPNAHKESMDKIMGLDDDPHGKSSAPSPGGTLMTAMSQLQSDAPPCDVCGAITVRSGTCYKCLNCGNSMGCS